MKMLLILLGISMSVFQETPRTFLVEYPGLTVRVENGRYMMSGERYITRMGDTVQVLSVRADTVTFNTYCVHGTLKKVQ